jgi:hypothetical protein
MRRLLRTVPLCCALLLAGAAARAQSPQAPAQDSRCAALRAAYLGAVSDKAHRTVEEQARVEYEEARKYLRVCWDTDDEFTRSTKKFVMRHEAAERCRAAWPRLEPEIRGNGLVTPRKAEQTYEAAKEFLRVCDGAETEEARYVRNWAEKYEANTRSLKAEMVFWELVAEVRKGDAPAATYARMAEAGAAGLYEPRKRLLLTLLDSGKSLDSKEVRDAWAQVMKSLDTIIATYARAIALCGTRDGCQVAKGSWMTNLAKYYALRHDGSEEGLQEVISRGLDAPIPPPFVKP